MSSGIVNSIVEANQSNQQLQISLGLLSKAQNDDEQTQDNLLNGLVKTMNQIDKMA